MSRSRAERLRETLGTPELAWIVHRVRQRLEIGAPLSKRIALRTPSLDQRHALERLTGKPQHGTGLSVDLEQLEVLLRTGELCTDLRDAVENLTGPIADRRAERALRDAAWAALFTEVRHRLDGPYEPALQRWLEDLSETGILLRVSRRDVERARTLLIAAVEVALHLPADGINLAELAARATGDSHALDAGAPVATLAIRAAGAIGGMTSWSGTAERREVWARVGVLCDDLSSAVLTLGLSARGSSLSDRALRMHTAEGEPYRLSLRQLARDRPDFDVHDVVFVCENPSVVSAAAARLGSSSAPLVCIEGQPSTAARLLLDTLMRTRTDLRYHGDFDWPGIRIGNLVMARHGAKPWRFDHDAYVAAPSGTVLEGTSVVASWDPELAAAMADRGAAVHEEAVLEPLISDLAR